MSVKCVLKMKVQIPNLIIYFSAVYHNVLLCINLSLDLLSLLLFL